MVPPQAVPLPQAGGPAAKSRKFVFGVLLFACIFAVITVSTHAVPPLYNALLSMTAGGAEERDLTPHSLPGGSLVKNVMNYALRGIDMVFGNWVYCFIAAIGLTMVPLMLDMVDSFCPQFNIGRRMSLVLSPLMVLFIVVACSLGLAFFFDTFWLMNGGGVGLASVAVFLWFNMIANYILTVFTGNHARRHDLEPVNPGDRTTITITPRGPGAGPPYDIHDPKVVDVTYEDGTVARRRFPSDCIYCRVCDANILMHDHHCPFTAACVGGRNYVHFFLFLTYLWCGLAFGSWLSFEPFLDCLLAPLLGLWQVGEAMDLLCSELGATSLVGGGALAALGGVSFLYGFHCIQMLSGRSTRGLLKLYRACQKEAGYDPSRWLCLIYGIRMSDLNTSIDGCEGFNRKRLQGPYHTGWLHLVFPRRIFTEPAAAVMALVTGMQPPEKPAPGDKRL